VSKRIGLLRQMCGLCGGDRSSSRPNLASPSPGPERGQTGIGSMGIGLLRQDRSSSWPNLASPFPGPKGVQTGIGFTGIGELLMAWVVGVPLLGRVSLPGNEIDSESQQHTSVLISGSSRLVQ
jgi:hypothetical protein